MSGKRVLAALVLVAITFSFLGLPVPEWLENIVNLVAGMINSAIAGLMKITSLVQFLLQLKL